MFKLHIISELKEAFLNVKDTTPEIPKAAKSDPLISFVHKKMMIYDNKCIGCGACATVCPALAITVLENSKHRIIDINTANCIYCGLCVEACPEEAITSVSGNELPSLNKDNLHHELRIKLKRCEHCRKPVGTKKGVLKTVKDLFSKRGINTKELEWLNLCSSCRRKFQSSVLIRQSIE